MVCVPQPKNPLKGTRLFSFSKKNKIDTSTPLKFKASILAKPATISDLSDSEVFQSWAQRENTREYMQVLEDLALRGNAPSGEFVAQFYLMTAARITNEDSKIAMSYKALKFGALAAVSGVTTEALNIPITALKLSGMLIQKDGDSFTKEVQSLIQLAHKWHNLNSNNQNISATDRRRSSEGALQLKNSWPELDDQQNSNNAQQDAKEREEATLRVVVNVLMVLGQDAPNAVSAGEMVKEALQNLSTNEISKCNVDAMVIFVLMKVARSALEDGEREMAEMLTRTCEPVAKKLITTPSSIYSDLEFSMIGDAIEAMKRIDLK